MQVKDPAERFDLSYLFANGSAEDIEKLASTAKEIKARCAMVHVADLETLIPALRGGAVRPEVVIDFPDGLGGYWTKRAETKRASELRAVGADLVINLRHVAKRKCLEIMLECSAVSNYFPEIKLISQIPYLWQKDREAIPWLLDLLPKADVYCVKDWTTRQNFILPENETFDTSTDTRIRYTEFMANYIVTHSLPLLIKIAGKVDATNARQFVNAGADLIGLSHGKAKVVREALL